MNGIHFDAYIPLGCNSNYTLQYFACNEIISKSNVEKKTDRQGNIYFQLVSSAMYGVDLFGGKSQSKFKPNKSVFFGSHSISNRPRLLTEPVQMESY